MLFLWQKACLWMILLCSFILLHFIYFSLSSLPYTYFYIFETVCCIEGLKGDNRTWAKQSWNSCTNALREVDEVLVAWSFLRSSWWRSGSMIFITFKLMKVWWHDLCYVQSICWFQGSLEFMNECTTIEYPFSLYNAEQDKTEIGYATLSAGSCFMSAW